MVHFQDQNELMTFAKQFITDRLTALEKDVKHCIDTKPYAPLPAISYCFSTVNLLGELSVRKRPGKTRDSDYQTQTYMQTFMNYNSEQTELLMQIFRHKVAHLAIPNPLYIDSRGRRMIWWYVHKENPVVHLRIEQAAQNSEIEVIPNWKVPYDHSFHLSIGSFVADIKKSIDDGKGEGYLVKLQNDPDLQAIFQDTICELYGL